MRNSSLLSQEMRCKKIESMNKIASVPHSSLLGRQEWRGDESKGDNKDSAATIGIMTEGQA